MQNSWAIVGVGVQLNEENYPLKTVIFMSIN